MKNEQTDSQMASFSCAGRPFSPGRCPLVEMGGRAGISRTWGYKRRRLMLEGKFLSRTQPFGRVCVQKVRRVTKYPVVYQATKATTRLVKPFACDHRPRSKRESDHQTPAVATFLSSPTLWIAQRAS